MFQLEHFIEDLYFGFPSHFSVILKLKDSLVANFLDPRSHLLTKLIIFVLSTRRGLAIVEPELAGSRQRRGARKRRRQLGRSSATRLDVRQGGEGLWLLEAFW